MIMRTFVEAFDWTGKTIRPFVTYAVSGLGAPSTITRGCAQGRRSPKGSRCAVRRFAMHAPISTRGCAAPCLLNLLDRR